MTPLFSFDEPVPAKKEILCHTCNSWVDCGSDDEKKGFCLCKDLFTYTSETSCRDYTKDKPITIEEFENGTYKPEEG